MPDLIALTRELSRAIERCELTHRPRVPIDWAKASAQHAEYERLLTSLGCSVQRVTPELEMADSVFVEDTAIVLDEMAVMTRPGAESRRGETAAVAEILKAHRRMASVVAPGTLDGGDVLVVGRLVFVGASSRANRAGIEQLRRFVEPLGYAVAVVALRGCLHLKSAVTALANDVLLLNPESVSHDAFPRFERMEVDPGEGASANVLRIGGRIVCAAAFPRTRERLERRGFQVAAVDLSEVAKAEGAVTCCSLVFAPGGSSIERPESDRS